MDDNVVTDFDWPTEGPGYELLDSLRQIMRTISEEGIKGLLLDIKAHFLLYGTQEQAVTMDEIDFIEWLFSSSSRAG